MLTVDLAYRMRHERGIILPIVDEYETEELKEMAFRFKKLSDEMDRLDKRLYEMHNKTSTINR